MVFTFSSIVEEHKSHFVFSSCDLASIVVKHVLVLKTEWRQRYKGSKVVFNWYL